MSPLSIGLGLRLPLAGGPSLDPDAAARIAQIETAKGSAMTAPQRAAIDTFFKAAKANYWTTLKCFYLPVWGNAAANAIDLVSGNGGGSWFNGPTHSSGYVQCNGTNQYFDSYLLPSSLGITTQNESLFSLIYLAATAGSRAFVGCYAATTSEFYLASSGLTTIRADMNNNGTGFVTNAATAPVGILCASYDGQIRKIHKRSASGFSTPVSVSNGISGTMPAQTIKGFCIANGIWNSDAGMGAFGAGTSRTTAQDEAFSLHLKTLWETITGLTLPA